MTKVYTMSEVQEHLTYEDCWLVIGGKVYDVTKFLEEHPGGDDVLLSSTGKDATEDFEDAGHSEGAREMLAQYLVGEIEASTIAPKTGKYIKPIAEAQQKERLILKILQFVVPLAILVVAVTARFLTRKKEVGAGP